MQRLGWNVHNKVDDTLLAWMEQYKTPSITLVSPGEMDQAANAERILASCPDTTVIYRVHTLSNGLALDMNTPITAMAPDDFWYYHRNLIARFGDRIVYHAWNEANKPSNVDAYHRWHTELEYQAQDRGLRIAHCSYGTGSPDLPYYDTPSAIAFYQSLQDGDWRSYLCWHEYVPGNQEWLQGYLYHIGRLIRTFTAMHNEGIYPPEYAHFAITELGTEGVNKSMGQYGRSIYWVRDQIKTMHENLYDTLQVGGRKYHIDTHWYCYGDWGGWQDHDVTRNAALLSALGAYMQAPTPIVNEPEEPEVSVCDNPIPALNTSEANTRWRCTVDSLRVRKYPAAVSCAEVAGSLAQDDIVLIKGTVFCNGYIWLVLNTGSDVDLYCALSDEEGSTHYMERVEDPVQEDYAIVFMTNDVNALATIQYLALHSGGAIKLSEELFAAIAAAQQKPD